MNMLTPLLISLAFLVATLLIYFHSKGWLCKIKDAVVGFFIAWALRPSIMETYRREWNYQRYKKMRERYEREHDGE